MHQLVEHVDQALTTTAKLSYPAAFVRASDFVKFGRLLSHEQLRNEGKLFFCDTYKRLVHERRYVMFLSQCAAAGRTRDVGF